jgi:co-chaperonin GroES (HSP10)
LDFKCDTPPVQVGDEVYYAKYGAKVLKDEDTGELYIICNDEDVLVGYTNE